MVAGVKLSGFEDRNRLYVQRLVALRPAPDEEAEAHLRWGKPSEFQMALSGGAYANGQPSITVHWPDDECDPNQALLNRAFGLQCEDPPPAILQWNEIARDTEEVRVENPDDADQYVIVERIDSIIFQGPDGFYHQFNLNHPAS